MEFRERLQQAIAKTEQYLRDCDYRGYDPYDGLMSPLFDRHPFRDSRRLRLATQQLVRRIPFQVRPLLRIPPGYNPVTLALVLQAYSYRLASGEAEAARYAGDITHLVDELDRLRSTGYHGACWGYDFFWQSKFATNPPYHPTIVATGFATNALFVAWRLTASDRAASLIREAAEFFTRDLNRIPFERGFSWSYSPSDRRAVINATLKGARYCAQAHAITGDPALLELAAGTVRFAADHQQPDGRWPYAVNDPRGWADNFHTGYVLDCLDEYQRLSGDDTHAEVLARGVRYYLEHFFVDGVIPRYYDRRTYPVDATACAQSLLTLCRFGKRDQAVAVCEWCLDHLALPDGSFKYQLHRRWENRLVFVRWSVAWMFLAMCRLERVLTDAAGSGNRLNEPVH